MRVFLLSLLLSAGAAAHAVTSIMVFGDSLSTAYGLAQGTGWVDLLQQRLLREGGDYRVVNVSLSGETTQGGRSRIAKALEQHKPQWVILALGGNDGLRGTKVESTRANLGAIITECRKRNARVLLVGVQVPPNYGSVYAEKFREVFISLARSERIPLVPSIFKGFGTDREWFLPDGIHPTANAQPRILDNIWELLGPSLRADRAGRRPPAK